MYVLIVIAYLSGAGSIATMQDFSSKETCEAAKKIVAVVGKGYCVPK